MMGVKLGFVVKEPEQNISERLWPKPRQDGLRVQHRVAAMGI